MSVLSDRIAQFRKMAQDDPENELGHYRLGQLLAEDQQFGEAALSFQKTIELSPQFSKAYQLLGEVLSKDGKKAEAIEALTKGFKVADERGDLMPRDAMGKLLVGLGAPLPQSQRPESQPAPGAGSGTGGFACKRPGCLQGRSASQLPAPPIKDEIGKRVFEEICAQCWNAWLRDHSIKVINELRLNLSDEKQYAEYDRYMKEFFGFEGERISLG